MSLSCSELLEMDLAIQPTLRNLFQEKIFFLFSVEYRPIFLLSRKFQLSGYQSLNGVIIICIIIICILEM